MEKEKKDRKRKLWRKTRRTARGGLQVDIGEGERAIERWWWCWLVLHMIWEKEEKTMDKNTVEMWWRLGTQKSIQKKEKEIEEN